MDSMEQSAIRLAQICEDQQALIRRLIEELSQYRNIDKEEELLKSFLRQMGGDPLGD